MHGRRTCAPQPLCWPDAVSASTTPLTAGRPVSDLVARVTWRGNVEADTPGPGGAVELASFVLHQEVGYRGVAAYASSESGDPG